MQYRTATWGWLVKLFFISALVTTGTYAVAAPSLHVKLNASQALTPTPSLTPIDVVRIQVDALRQNSPSDEGIILTYQFASPRNKRVTGPLQRFVDMVRSAPYDRLINHQSVRYGPTAITADKAYQPVIVTDGAGQEAGYIWALSRQVNGVFKDCWMTDAVYPRERSAPYRLAELMPAQLI